MSIADEVFDVTGTVVLVTGAGSGLGRSIAETLAGCGATVIAADRDEARLKQLHDVDALPLDVSDAAAVEDAVSDVVRRHGRLDTVFANAGIARGAGLTQPAGSVDAFELDDWHALLEVNLHGVAHTVRAAARPMKRQRSGSIVVTASTAGLRADPFVSYSYVVAKAGVVNLVRQAALDLARWRIRVNAIAPGPFKTNIGGGEPNAEAEARWGASVALGRMGDPRELRGLALLFASGASSFVTGSVYAVDGGALLQSMALDPAPEGT
ncbi:SDR family NAD(P)-dependent oxidoreductase [Amycolatopsis alkalitolerans]|uniref:SDR family oxidoreductase n=1 Tax=Amycolatopsis alkalitolerans TaxID=2547244 RepID=A0A5C4M208_9PSEU|nr:SDR family NAD(P)-dependent oxidoreductase [Amycolatopsis alkalitolerans]TNC26865.1 SDR family oxidoreductase [Amycolatopsis alkalitolerans]